jgi:phenylalanyl-tRNA synthetase beta chain
MDVATHVAVRNPIASELSHLRRSLLPGLFTNLLHNVRNFQEFRLFEIGREIHPVETSSLPHEITRAAGLIYSAHADEQDFFEVKRTIECLFPSARLSAVEARRYEHPTRTALINWSGERIGRVFEIHPSLLHAEGVEGRAVFFDVDLELAHQAAAHRSTQYVPLGKYPTSGFDLSVVAELREPVARIEDLLTKLAQPDLTLLDFVRQYAGPPLPEGRKSVSYHLEVGAPDHTLTADQVTLIRNRIIHGMRQEGYELRV